MSTERDEWRAIAEQHIAEESEAAHDCAAFHGQTFDNVKHMSWFKDAMVEFLMGSF